MAPRCKNLVLDSGPLLSLSPLRGLADNYLTVPQVLDELKDKRAREHFHQLGLSAGVRVDIRNPNPASLNQVIQFAKKTGDYAVLSHADICVLALTHTLQLEGNGPLDKEERDVQSDTGNGGKSPSATEKTPAGGAGDVDDLDYATKNLSMNDQLPEIESHGFQNGPTEPDGDSPVDPTPEAPLYDDPLTDKEDGLGEWITPGNVALHKSRALGFLPSPEGVLKKKSRLVDEQKVWAGCMTADFAMQNVLLQMGLTLVGTEGRQIQKVKTWLLRCHACFKVCRDNSKQFCPSCGNPTLIRASVTLSSPTAAADAPVMEVHLKKNFQYKLRGTKYSIPTPRPGSAKTGPGEGLILREDQLEYMRAKKRADGKRERAEKRMFKGLVDRSDDGGVAVGSWSNPDWIPGILDGSTKGRSRGKDDMPQIGYGRRNPNERRRH